MGWPQTKRRNSARKRIAVGGIILAIAVCLKTVFVSTTFAVAQQESLSGSPRALSPVKGEARVTVASGREIPFKASGATKSLPGLGGVLLLCACAFRVRSGRQVGRSGRHVVTCNALSLTCTPSSKSWQTPEPVHVTASVTAAIEVRTVVPSPALQSPVAAPPTLSSVLTACVSEPHEPGAEEPSVAGKRWRGKSARFAGSSRHSRSRSAHSSRAGSRAARRSVGARLQQSPVHTSIPEPSFDASRQRTKVQVGLRAVQRAPSCSARESQTPSTSHGLNDQSGVLVATYFETSGRNRNG